MSSSRRKPKKHIAGRHGQKTAANGSIFDVVLDTSALAARFKFPPCVKVHENLDQKSGLERGFKCVECKDGIMGLVSGAEIFREGG